VSFSEALRDPAGHTALDDVTNPANYRLVAPGGDQDFATHSCATGVTSDDILVPIDGVAYDGAAQTATLQLDGGPLGDALYRLLLCASLRDLGDQPLDGNGDGVGGDDLVLGFRVDRFNLFANGHFDPCHPAPLAPWLVAVTAPDEVVPSLADHDGSPLSGSARMRIRSVSTTALGQCVAVEEGRQYQQRSRRRITSTVNASGMELVQWVRFFDAAQCAGNLVGAGAVSTALTDGAGEWLPLGHGVQAPGGAVSALCAFRIEPQPGSPPPASVSFDADLDTLFFGAEGLFQDDFESGDLSAWSMVVP